MNAARAEVLRFWRSIELFSPQPVPNADPRERVHDLGSASVAPWDAEHPFNSEPIGSGQRWRHTVYCGVFKRDAAFDLLRCLLPADAESFDDRRVAGEGALFAFVVSDDGQALLGSEVLSSCAWAIGRAISPGPAAAGWLEGLEDAEAALSETVEDLFAEPDDADEPDDESGGRPIRPLTIEDLRACTERIVELLGVQQLSPNGIRIQSRALKASSADRADEHDFLNGFIAEDLALVADEVAAGNFGSALRSYLCADEEIDFGVRVDVESRLDVVHAAVAPDRVPLGRWPVKAQHPLGLSQQLAVASAIESLADGSGIFAVNGPPGTGKTTMLREIVADVVVRRAQRLAELSDPQDAFAAKHTWKTGDYTRVVHEFEAHLTGFEMVVACTTNAAAENISIEIPGIGAIDADRRADIDYYPQLASRLLNAKRQDRSARKTDTEAWAMVAGCLGNMDNRARFARALWFSENSANVKPSPRDASATPRAPAPAMTERLGLLDILKGYESAPPESSWSDAVAAFRVAEGAARVLAQQRARVFELLEDTKAVEQDAERWRQRAATAPGALADARQRLSEHERIAAACRDDVNQRVQARRDHREFRPSFRESLFSAGRAAMRAWHARDLELADAVDASEADAAAAQAHLERLRELVAVAERQLQEHAAAEAAAAARLRALRVALGEARERYGRFVPDELWWQDRRRRERKAPWIDAEWNAARTDLFLAALRLHKAFAVAAAKQMRQSVHGAVDILKGDAPADLPEAAALAAWRSLFFMVPVLSTSFASFARVFSHLRRESLGWLFVDEAGQCTAQNPAGAIWRSRRVVVVGDPLQLEPVVTLPFTAQQAIRREHDVAETWLPSNCSAQTLADRVSHLGTFRGSGSDAIWVGAPLNVHRRCDDAIFQIVNQIAYDGQMVNATAERPPLTLPPSKWLDIAASHSDGHWIAAEGEKLNTILEHLRAQEHDFAEVFVLTPFRQVAGHLYALRRRYPGITVGTVHTAQGREADIVILVLGGNPQRPGARRWAAAKPNLLNVAVSRAKRRIYVIGDRTSWAQQPYFKVLAEHLPTS